MTSCARLSVSLLAHWVGESSSAVGLGASWVLVALLLLLAHWETSIVGIVEELALEVLLLVWRASSKGEAQELVCPPCLHVLLVEQVEEQVLITLDESLRVYLPMLELLVSVSLDSLQESGQCHLLLPPQPRFLLLDYGLDLLFLSISFFLLFEVAFHVQLLGLLVALGVHQFLDLLPHVHELFREGDLRGLFLSNLLM